MINSPSCLTYLFNVKYNILTYNLFLLFSVE